MRFLDLEPREGRPTPDAATPLGEFAARGVLPAGGRWTVITIALGIGLAALTAVLTADRPGPVLAVTAVTAVVLVVLLFRPAWFARWAEVTAIVSSLAVCLLTDGAESPYRLFLVFPFAWAAMTRTPRGIAVVWMLGAATRFVLVWTLGGDATVVALGLATLEVALWSTVGLGVWGLRAAVGRVIEDLGRSEIVHRALVEGHSSGVYVLDEEFRIAEVNDALLRLLGWEEQDALGRSVLSFVPEELHEDAIRFASHAMRGRPMPYESVAVAADGERIPMLVTHALIEIDGEAMGLYGILQDLRGIREERDARQSIQARFEQMAESSSEGMFVVRLSGKGLDVDVDYVNASLAAMLGLTVTTMVDDVDTALAGLSGPDRVLLVRHLRAGEVGRHLELQYRRPDGAARWLEIRTSRHEVPGVPAAEGRSEALGRQGIVRDVTRLHEEREALAAALAQERRAAEELRRTQQMQATFLQSLSHEIRTPLTAISGLLTTLRARADRLEPDTSRHLLARAEANADRLASLLVDLLDVERLAVGAPGVVAIEGADLAAAVSKAVDGRPTLAWRVVTALEPGIRVGPDPSTLGRIVGALLDNATQHAGSASIRVDVVRDATHGVLRVEDDGPGLSEELLASAFEPFAQGEHAHASASPGTGIGLALVRRLVEAGGGSVRAVNLPGGGACFEVRLPCLHDAP